MIRTCDDDEREVIARERKEESERAYLTEHKWTELGYDRWVDPYPRRHRGQISVCTTNRALQRQRFRDKSPYSHYPVEVAEYQIGERLQVFRGKVRKRESVVIGHIESGRSLVLSHEDARELAETLLLVLEA